MFTILLVDDERSERMGVRFLIKKYALPLTIAEAANGQEALAYIQKHPVDILFTDIKMPYMDGLVLAKTAHAYNPSLRIIVFSAHGEFEYAKKAMEAGVVNYLLKPIELDEFQQVMRTVIAQCEQAKEQMAQERENELASRRQALFQALTGTGVPDNAPYPCAEGHLALLNVESRNDLFEKKEAAFLKLAGTHAPYPYEYINLYPNAAYLLLHSQIPMSQQRVVAFAKKLVREVDLALDEVLTILVGPVFHGAAALRGQAQHLNNLRANIYEGDQAVIQTTDLSTADMFQVDTVEECKARIITATEHRDMDETALQFQRLVVCLEKSNALSVIYMHHLMYDLISMLYRKLGFTDMDLIHSRIEEVVKSLESRQLSASLQRVMAEVTRDSALRTDTGVAERVIQIIEANYGKDIGLDFIAEQVHLSSAYLSFLFKQETGTNIIRYLADYRMKKACELLAGSNMKVADIAQRCGYANPSYFNRLFKNVYGITPTQYREAKA